MLVAYKISVKWLKYKTTKKSSEVFAINIAISIPSTFIPPVRINCAF